MSRTGCGDCCHRKRDVLDAFRRRPRHCRADGCRADGRRQNRRWRPRQPRSPDGQPRACLEVVHAAQSHGGGDSLTTGPMMRKFARGPWWQLWKDRSVERHFCHWAGREEGRVGSRNTMSTRTGRFHRKWPHPAPERALCELPWSSSASVSGLTRALPANTQRSARLER